MGLNTQSRLSVTGLLLFGTTTSLLAKIVYELEGEGRDGHLKVFAKPWAMTTVMFLGMSICLPLAYLEEARARKGKLTAVEEPLIGDADVEPVKATTELRQLALLCIPTVFDLVATVLMNVGLLSVTASVYQMMRGAEMLFAALFTLLFLGRELNRKHVLGIVFCVAGIALVGTSSVLGGEGSSTQDVSPKQMLTGMGLIVASQAVQAGQLTFEDFFMADMNVAPLKIVGVEGLFGSIIMLAAVLPVVQFLPGKEGRGLHEDSIDTWHMITHSGAISGVLLVDMAALLMYNLSGMCVTGYLGAVFRTVLETMRTLFVWLVDLLLFYTPLGVGRLGESWTAWSFLQAAGFLVLVSGTLVYGRGDDKEIEKEAEEAEEEASGTGPAQRGPSAPTAIARRSPRHSSQPIAMSGSHPSSYKSTMNIGSFRPSATPRSHRSSFHGHV